MFTNAVREEIPIDQPKYTTVLDRAGVFTANAPLNLTINRRVETNKLFYETVLLDNPDVFYRLNETSGTDVDDASVNALDGTYVNSPTLAQDAPLIAGEPITYAVAFNGSTHHITRADDVLLRPGETDFSFEFIIKRDGQPPSDEYLLSKGDATVDGYKVWLNTSGQIRYRIGAITATGNIDVCDNSYHHIVLTIGRNSSCLIYVDRVLDTTTDISSESTRNLNGTDIIYVGRRSSGSYFTGNIGMAAYYGGQALTPGRITTHYNSFVGNKEVVISYSTTYDQITRRVLDPGRTKIFIERDGTIVWGGILWTVKAVSDVGAQEGKVGGRVEFGASSLWGYFHRLLILTTKSYTNQDILYIARDLIDYGQAKYPPYANIAVNTGTETAGYTRTRVYKKHEVKPIGEAIEQLAALDVGFDFEIINYWSGGTITSDLKLYYPERKVRTNQTLELGTNVNQVEWDVDSTRQGTRLIAVGHGDEDSKLMADSGAALLGEYPLLERSYAYGDVKIQSTLNAHAAADQERLKYPVETPFIKIVLDPNVTLGTFHVGDEFRIIADLGWEQVDSWQRLMEYSVQPDDTGKESITLSFGGKGEDYQ